MKKIAKVDGAPAPRAPYSTYTQAGNLIFVAGQVAMDPQTQETPASFAAQLHLILKNLKTILESAGSSLENILKTTVFLKDLSNYAEYNEIYRQYFKNGLPARSTVVADLVREDFLIEIEAIAWKLEKQSK
ncbi:MAG: RidA family protein [Desulfobacterales bacterium]|jgi:2-iminobutanoate/2-iminopropanoate deaminase|nr:RidA family protein [Desulfobacterales bacterium]